ncbi:hypothetical protein GGI21_000116 [Coemansia aciculifera]|uniref:Uncharacterized protein n=1 Tax=Coemansia aciculifera TaxID=417176 RepID=A0ACC1M7Y9_9FUNG|nr:hypothetical protein IWW38_000980 [Coemansia aciculifera]KAJ2911202.1 hypothetical protein GGI21_000116 [Coemansia aciculifera]
MYTPAGRAGNSSVGNPVLPGDIGQALAGLAATMGNGTEIMGGASEWSFVVSDQWVMAIQSLAIVSLISSAVVLIVVAHIAYRHSKYLQRLSLRVSGYVALGDLLSSIAQIIMLQNNLMMEQTESGLRFILWLSMFSTLLFVFLTLSISIQLHLSTLTNIRVAAYMRLERWYVPASVVLAAVLPAIAVAQMRGIFWVPYMHAFSWPAESWVRRLVLWMCNYVWVVLTIAYCSGVSLLLSLRIWAMWRSSVEVIAAPRMPEKWDWNRLTSASSIRESHDAETLKDSGSTSEFSVGAGLFSPTATDERRRQSLEPMRDSNSRRGYLVTTLNGNNAATVAVRSYVDKRRFLRSVQRLACYPLVPIVTQLGVVAMNMTAEPSKGLYVYGTAMACLSGLLNMLVFLLNPALPDIWRDAALASL